MSHTYPVVLRFDPSDTGLLGQVRIRAKGVDGRIVVQPTTVGVSADTAVAGQYPAKISLPDFFSGFIQGSANGIDWTFEEGADPLLIQKIAATILGIELVIPDPPEQPVYEEFDPAEDSFSNITGTVLTADGGQMTYVPGQVGYAVMNQPTSGERPTLDADGFNGEPSARMSGVSSWNLDALARLFSQNRPFTVGGEGNAERVGNPTLTLLVRGATNATPIVITTGKNGLVTGDLVTITGVAGNTAANGSGRAVTVVDEFTFSLDGIAGNGDYTSGGTIAGVVGATNATPIVIKTLVEHGAATGDKVTIASVLGNTAANGTFVVTVLSDYTFSLDTSVGNGAYTGGGTVTRLQQTLLSLGDSSDGLKFLLIYLTAANVPRLSVRYRNGSSGAVVDTNGQFLIPGPFSWCVTSDGTYFNLYINGAPWGPRDVSANPRPAANRVTVGGQRTTGAASLQLNAGFQMGRFWVLGDEAWTEAEVSAWFRETRERYNLNAIDLAQRVAESAPHQSWPDLIYYTPPSGTPLWVLAYREATGHLSLDGVGKVLVSEDFETWELVATLEPAVGTQYYQEMRFCTLDNGNLGLFTYRGDTTFTPTQYKTWLLQSADGRTWDETPGAGQQIGPTDYRIWCVRHLDDEWHGIGYRTVGISPVNITDASNTTPIVITAVGHGLATGEHVDINSVEGNTAANGLYWPVTVLTADTYSLDGSVGNGGYTTGGVMVRLVRTTYFRSTDGVTWTTAIENFVDLTGATESDLAMGADGTIYLIMRIDGGPAYRGATGYVFGHAAAPYAKADWTLTPIATNTQRAQAPYLLYVGSELFVGHRGGPGNRIQISRVNTTTGALTTVIEIPAEDDCAYIHLQRWPDGSRDVALAYYSSHQLRLDDDSDTRACIYVARWRPPDV